RRTRRPSGWSTRSASRAAKRWCATTDPSADTQDPPDAGGGNSPGIRGRERMAEGGSGGRSHNSMVTGVPLYAVVSAYRPGVAAERWGATTDPSEDTQDPPDAGGGNSPGILVRESRAEGASRGRSHNSMVTGVPLYAVVIDYLLGVVMWTLIGRFGMRLFLPE